MKRLPEAVTTKFIELFAALHSATDDLKMAGAESCLIGDFSQVTVINDSCRKLQALESEIRIGVQIGSEWVFRLSQNMQRCQIF